MSSVTRILMPFALAGLMLPFAACSAQSTDASAKASSASPTPTATTPAYSVSPDGYGAYPAGSTPDDDTDSTPSGPFVEGNGDGTIHKFGTTFVGSTGMGEFTVGKPYGTTKVSQEERESGVFDKHTPAKSKIDLAIRNLSATKPLDLDGLETDISVGEYNSNCLLTGQDVEGSIRPGRTKRFDLQCGSTRDGRLTMSFDSAQYGEVATVSNEE